MKIQKPKICRSNHVLSLPLLCLSIAALLISSSRASASSLYWDTNGVTAGSGAATGTWGTSSFWNTDSAGTTSTFTSATTISDDLIFSAGANGTAGTVTVSATQSAGSLTLQQGGNVTVSGGTSITLGGGGLNFSSGTGSNTIGTSLVLGANAAFTNKDDSTQTISGGVTGAFNLDIANNSTGAITLSTGSINHGGSLTHSGTGTGTLTINSVIGPNVTALTQNSRTSQLTLGGTNTYAGATTVNGGTILLSFTGTSTGATRLSASSALNLGGGTFSMLGTATAGQTSSQTVNGVAVNPGASAIVNTVGGAGLSSTLALGAITHNSGGMLSFTLPTTGSITTSTGNTNGILGTWATVGAAGATQYVTGGGAIAGFTGTAAPTAANVTDTTGAANYDVAAVGALGAGASFNTLRYTGATGTITGAFSANGLMNAGAAANILTMSGGVTIGADKELVVNTANGSLTLSGAIADNGGGLSALTVGGANTVTLSGTNTYTGKTTVNGGTLSFNTLGNVGAASSALGAPTTTANGTIELGNATLTYTGGTTTSDRVIDLHMTGATSTINFQPASASTLTLTGGVTGTAGTLILRNGTSNANITETGLIAIGTAGLTRSAAFGTTSGSTVTLTNAGNNFTGKVAITSGTLSVNSIADSGVNSALGAGSQIDLGNNSVGADAVGVLVFTGASGGSTNRTITIQTGGNGGGAGTISHNTAGQTLTLNGNISTAISGAGGTPGLTLTGAGDGVVNGNILNGPATTFPLIKSGTGTWTLTGANTYNGATTIQNGTLSVASIGNTASASSNLGSTGSTIKLGSSTTTGTLVYTGPGETSNRIIDLSGTTGGGKIDQSGTGLLLFTGANTATGVGSKTLTLQGSTSGAGEISGGIVNGSGTTSVVKSGTGTWTLSGNNTYTGATTINGGVFLVSGTLSGTSSVTVNSGAFNYTNAAALNRNVTVAGGNFKYNSTAAYSGALTFTSGTISGSGNLSGTALNIGTGQTISPGNSPGTANTGAQTWANGGSYLWEINALATSAVPGSEGADPGWDFLNITGALTITAGVGQFNLNVDSLLALDNWVNTSSYQWRIATASLGVTGFAANKFSIDSSAFSDQNTLGTGSFSVSNVGNDIYLNYTESVPEPSAIALLYMGSIWLLRRRVQSGKRPAIQTTRN